MVSITKKQKIMNALILEVSAFREEIDALSFRARRLRTEFDEMKRSGVYAQSYLDEKEKARDRLIGDLLKEADARRDRAMIVIKYRIDQLKEAIHTDFSETPRGGFVENIRLRRELGVPFTAKELELMTLGASTYSELQIVNMLAEKQARTPSDSVMPRVSDYLPSLPPTIDEELASLRDAQMLAETFIRDYGGECGDLVKVEKNDLQPVVASQAIAVIDAWDNPKNSISALMERLDADYRRTEEGRKFASRSLTEDEKKVIDAVLRDSINKTEGAVRIAKADDTLRELFLRDERFRPAIIKAEIEDAKRENNQLGRE